MRNFYIQNESVMKINIVMDYIPNTLLDIIGEDEKRIVPILLLKLYSYQLLRSIAYIHAKGICHADIKSNNVLVDTDSHFLKLCDFNLSKYIQQVEPYTYLNIGIQWHFSPE